MAKASERRWIILASDGRHVTVGRDGEPSEADLDHAADGLKRLGLGGWLAVMTGQYYCGEQRVDLVPVRGLAETGVKFGDACILFHQRRQQANG